MSFDLNKPLDFARVTNSVASSAIFRTAQVLDQIRGKSGTQWKIYEGAYKGVKFHTFSKDEPSPYNAALSNVTDSSGRRKAVYKFPYVDGQTTDDLGRDGYTFSVEILFHGANYAEGWNAFKEILEKDPKPGLFTHPIIGDIQAVPLNWQFTHESATRQSVAVKVTFTEHNFGAIGEAVELEKQDFNSALSNSLPFLTKINNILNKIDATVKLAQSVKAFLKQATSEIENAYRLAMVQMNVSFNGGVGAGLPQALPINQGGTTNPSGTQNTTRPPVAASPTDPFANTQNTTTVPVLNTKQAVDVVNNYKSQVSQQIKNFQDNDLELDFYNEILDLQLSTNALQRLTEAGVKSSKARIIDYVLPRNMSIREVSFINGLDPDDMVEVDKLNPFIESVNDIPKGTTMQIPVSA